jgi:hypothetical protein
MKLVINYSDCVKEIFQSVPSSLEGSKKDISHSVVWVEHSPKIFAFVTFQTSEIFFMFQGDAQCVRQD